MILTIDVDNVLSDTIGKFCGYVTINKGIKLEKNEVTYHKLPGKNKLTNDEIFYILNLLWENWENLPLLDPNSPKIISKLKNNNFIINIATSRPLRSVNYVKSWLKLHDIEYDQFLPLGPYKAKNIINSDYFIEDAPEHIKSISDNGKFTFIYDQPWNRTILLPNVQRIYHFQNILEYFKID
jgi:5'(3')-deoxyribonucleotidase